MTKRSVDHQASNFCSPGAQYFECTSFLVQTLRKLPFGTLETTSIFSSTRGFSLTGQNLPSPPASSRSHFGSFNTGLLLQLKLGELCSPIELPSRPELPPILSTSELRPAEHMRFSCGAIFPVRTGSRLFSQPADDHESDGRSRVPLVLPHLSEKPFCHEKRLKP